MSRDDWVRVGRKDIRLSSIIIIHYAFQRVSLSNGIHLDCGEEEFENILELLGLK